MTRKSPLIKLISKYVSLKHNVAAKTQRQSKTRFTLHSKITTKFVDNLQHGEDNEITRGIK